MENLLFCGINLINIASFQVLAIKFLVNLITISILVIGIYYPINRKSEYLLNFYIFNILIFFVASLLSDIELNTGFAFGIFAVFSVLRYRTEPIPIKEMTFLFISIIIAIINSTVTLSLSYAEILFANIVIILATYLMEKRWLQNYKPSKIVEFEIIELIHADRRLELIAELENRLGSKIYDVEVQKISFLKDTAVLKVYME